jgi:hypothetical protein
MNEIERVTEIPVGHAEMIIFQPDGKSIIIKASGGKFTLEKETLTSGSTASFTLRFIDPALFAATEIGDR